MALVKGPNGLVYDWPTRLVDALTRGEGHERVEKSEPKAEEKPKRRTSPKAKK